MKTLSLPPAALALLVSLIAAGPWARAQQEIGFIEDFALADDRGTVLERLIPGTEDYYYYHALHYQNTRQAEKFADILAQWTKRFPNSGARKQILNREALIDYSKSPQESLEYIRREMGLRFDHQQEGKAREQDFPSDLNQAEVTWSKFLEDALRGTNSLQNLQDQGLFRLLAGDHNLTPVERRELLQRASLPDLPQLVDLILADLNSKESRGFGEFPIHGALTLDQLAHLRERKADLLRNENYVHTYLAKLRPGADSNPAAEPEVRLAYLENAWAFVNDLEPAFNSLKAHILYQRLLFDHARGVHDKDRFMTYIKLPRNIHYIPVEWRREAPDLWRAPADLGRDFKSITALPPIGTDEPLVRDYLLIFLKDAENYAAYSPYFNESWLKEVFAEAKIVNGVGDPEQWASLLTPAAFQALKERVDIEFDPTSPEQFAITDEVKLRVHIKNVESLLVKVFEVNTLNYYLKNNSEVSTDLDLDGLVANHERSVSYDAPPQRRVAREFTFPEIENRRGIWIIEFIGGSKSSRALIRKGELHLVNETAGAGEVVTVLDEQYRPMPDAAVWFAGRRLECDEKGRVLLPFTNEPGQRTAVAQAADGFASLARFQHPAENYALAANIYIPREELRPTAKATVTVRPSLTVAGQPISLKRLDDVRLILTSTDLDGVTTTNTVPNFELFSDREATHEFRVPDRLATLTVQLLAKVTVASQGKKEAELADAAQFEVNGQLRTERVDDLYLSLIDGDYIVEMLGRTGEARAGQNLNVTVRRPEFKNTRSFTLKTNAAGTVNLGPLEGASRLIVKAPGGHSRDWELQHARRTHAGQIHATAGSPVRVPYFGALDRLQVAFFAVTSVGYTVDVFDRLTLNDGFLVATDLAAGDYRLILKESNQEITVRVAAGTRSEEFVFNKARLLELPNRSPAHLAKVATAGESLQIEVANAGPAARVHLIATRFLPDFDPFASLANAPRSGLKSGTAPYLPNLYLSGRKIGDEFRYILERRYAQKFPGNMLERPEILLNPWAVRDTDAEDEVLKRGEQYDRKRPGQPGAMEQAPGAPAAKMEPEGGSSQSINFLANPPALLLNLKPDEDGKISVDLAAFGDRQHVHVLVLDPEGASYQHLSLPARDTAVADLRLLNALDPERHFTEQDSVTILKEGDELIIPDLATARFEVFEDLSSAYSYLLAMREDPLLREFGFIVDWPNLDDAQKRAKYSQYACHELNFFLLRRDPGFFAKVIAPYLANKRHRTFLDQYLLESDLTEYLRPFDFNRLNAPERILFGRRVEGQLAQVRRDLRNRLALRPPDVVQEELVFQSALATSGLTWSADGAAIDKARARLAELQVDAALPVPETAPAGGGGGEAAGRAMRRGAGLQANRATLGEPEAPAEGESLQLGLARGRQLEEKAKEVRDELARRYNADFKNADGAVAFDAFGYDGDLDAAGVEALYRALESTKEWAETHYYHLPLEAHTFDLIPESEFWVDYAAYDGEGPFGSRHLGKASRNLHEALLALAVLDLPFKSPGSKSEIEDGKYVFTAAANAIAFHREIKEAGMAEDAPPLLVSQSYFRQDDRYRTENGERVDKFVNDEFIAGVVYGTQIVVTNPTSTRQRVDALIQIPSGAIPVLGHRATATEKVALEPYTTQRFERFFYFPLVGDYAAYPAHVSKEGKVIVHAEASSFNVVEKPTKVDEASWAHLSQWGTEEQVLAYLATENLHAIDLSEIAWRCRESEDFFKKAVAVLDRRGIYNRVVYSYAVHHNAPEALRQFLLVEGDFLRSCGEYLASDLITLDPVEFRSYQHLEYKPLVNARAHTVGGTQKILNAAIREHYQHLLRVLSQKASLDQSERLSVTYYLFLQDRAPEAIARLNSVDPSALPTRLQYDYFKAYAAFYLAEPEEARAIATGYTDYPVDRWRERFLNVIAQVDEIQGKGPELVSEQDRHQQQTQLAAAEPTLAMEVNGSVVTLDYHKITNVLVNYYEMDLEFLFSTSPFVSSESGSFSVIQPNRSERLQLPGDKRSFSFDLPREYQSKNVLVEVIAGGKKRSQAVYSNDLQTALSERYGILTVRHEEDGRPLPATYVKVYALTNEGPKFYKDGYTDLRGKFDYASVSTSDIADARKFSILVMSEGNGATVLEAPVPQR